MICLASFLLMPGLVKARTSSNNTESATEVKVVRVVVLLADNNAQMIVPVPAELGNGGRPDKNLYWGALYGLHTTLKRRAGWRRLREKVRSDPAVVTTETFIHEALNIKLYAEAFGGDSMDEALERFFSLASSPAVAGELVVYVGHNALMERPLPKLQDGGGTAAGAFVFACQSGRYFSHYGVSRAKAQLFTTQNMAPEGYAVVAAIEAWARSAPGRKAADAAARAAGNAYAKYQKISLRAGRGVFLAKSSKIP